MGKIFAIVRPSTRFTPGLAALGDMFVDAYHYFKYPSFYGFSLGHEVLFFDTLDDAKNYLLPQDRRADWGWLQRYMREDGIIELEVDDTSVTNITAIHRFSGLRDTFHRVGEMFEAVKTPTWSCARVESDKITPEVLQALSDMLKVRYVKPHSIDAKSDNPKAQLCRQLSARFNQEHGEPEKMITPTTGELLGAVGGTFTASLSLLGMLAPETRPLAIVSLIVGAWVAKKSFERVTNSVSQEEKKREYIRNNLFANDAGRNQCEPAMEQRVNSKKL